MNDQWFAEVRRQHIAPVLHVFRIHMIAKGLGIRVLFIEKQVTGIDDIFMYLVLDTPGVHAGTQ
jgi:hypothetical protein